MTIAWRGGKRFKAAKKAPPKLEKQNGKQVLESLIVQRLIDDAAKQKGVVIADNEIEGEIKVINDQMTSAGTSLKDQLAQQGMTEDDLQKQLTTHLKIEKLLADKIQVSDQEVEAYIKDQKVTLTKGQEAEIRNQVKEQIKENKVQEQTGSLITELKNQAKVKYYVNY